MKIGFVDITEMNDHTNKDQNTKVDILAIATKLTPLQNPLNSYWQIGTYNYKCLQL